jgi:hypothetical protein
LNVLHILHPPIGCKNIQMWIETNTLFILANNIAKEMKNKKTIPIAPVFYNNILKCGEELEWSGKKWKKKVRNFTTPHPHPV